MSGCAPDTSQSNLVYYLKAADNTPVIQVSIEGIMDPIRTLIDSGSSRNFLDLDFAKQRNIPLIPLQHTRAVIGINGKEIPERLAHQTSIKFTINNKTFKE